MSPERVAPTAIHRFVDEARAGRLDRVIGRMPGGWAVIAQSQLLPGYCLLLPDPVVPSLNDLDEAARARFLRDMTILGDAVLQVCRPHRLNYAMLGNLEPALHAHIIPRYASEPAEMRTSPIWSYPPEIWNAEQHAFDLARHASLQERLRDSLAGLNGLSS